MPKFFCKSSPSRCKQEAPAPQLQQAQTDPPIGDYCDVYLTHDSMSVRKAHNSGRNHLRNVVDYYQQIGHEKAQSVIDSITSSYAAEGQSASNPMLGQNPGVHPPPPFAFPPPGFPNMPIPPPGGRGMPMPPMPGMPMPPFPPGPGGMPMLPFPPPGGLPPNFQFPPLPGGFQPPPGFPPMPGPPGGQFDGQGQQGGDRR
ncbi:U1 small nuclear ribonucleoprotein C [Lachnellula suecica]|uniref:U1 small nuclear ribonucleoprotein C n=1 Tax=Lachnellula suecica TaxID=602035 RepID=A0A8T9CE13_9HELO|nr:U1 small nuclear ribonucleoprotein C [Lachnellula suecica]